MKTLDEITAAGATLAMHLNFGDGYGYVYRCVAEPRITIHTQGPKGRKSKRQRSRWFRIPDAEFLTLEEAVLALTKSDERAAQDAMWDQAAPRKPKPAYIPGILEDEA